MAESKKYHYGLGRRKEAIARVRLYSGKGDSKINQQSPQEYFKKNETLTSGVTDPLKLTGNLEKSYFEASVFGGGLAGQKDAICLGLARALVAWDESLRSSLRKAGFLTRNQKEKERKKYGLKRARKAPQFSKR